MSENPKITVESTSLEDLLIMGDDKLINCSIEYPTENGTIQSKIKIKQLTMKELKNLDIDPNKTDIKTSIEILKKSLYRQDETPFSQELILKLPVGVANAISTKILELSGVEKDMGF